MSPIARMIFLLLAGAATCATLAAGVKDFTRGAQTLCVWLIILAICGTIYAFVSWMEGDED